MNDSLTEMLSDKSRYKNQKTDSMRMHNAELVRMVISLVKEEGSPKINPGTTCIRRLKKVTHDCQRFQRMV